MKNYLSILLFITLSFNFNAQGPQGFNYQATVRNAIGDLILNQNVNFKFNILQGSQTAAPSYTETHDVQTDDLGQISLVIGKGAPSNGVFSDIDWSLGNYFLAIELDTGSGYVAMGITQFYSVPYALYAENAGSARVDLDTIVTKESEKAVTGGGIFDALANLSINSINDPKFRETLGSSWENQGGGDFTVVNSQITSRASAGILRNFIASVKIGDNLILSGVYKIPTGFEDSVPKIVCRAVTETDIHDILTIEVPSKEEGTYKITDSITITDELVPSGEILGLQIDVYFQQANVTFFDPVVIVGAKADYYNALIPEQGEITTETEIHKNVELTNYALYPDNPISIVDAEGNLVSNVILNTRMFDVLSHTVVDDDKLGKGFTFNIANDSNKTAFTFEWTNPNYMSFVIHKSTIESGDRLGFSSSSGGFAWLNLDGLTTNSTSKGSGFTINVLEIVGNYIRIECYHATDSRKKLWFDFDSTSDITIYDLIVSLKAYNKYATYKHIYQKNQSALVNKRAMTWGDSNLSTGIRYALKEQLGINVIVNGDGGRRIALNNGVNFTPITTSNHRTQTSDGNWLGSWYRKKAIKYAIDTYGSVDVMAFFCC
ncbi:hypothetical protein [Polaribacter sp. R77954]|uniref:hypothetical protein n=1 Tax=Polaribacter sp. R77954 TaxID=3093870 RepID=UPI0037CB3F52